MLEMKQQNYQNLKYPNSISTQQYGRNILIPSMQQFTVQNLASKNVITYEVFSQMTLNTQYQVWV